MVRKKNGLISRIATLDIELLRGLKYKINKNNENQKWVKRLAAIGLPLITIFLSFKLLSVSDCFFFAILVGLSYKFMVARFSYQAYRNKAQNEIAGAIVFPENPLLLRSLLMLLVILFLVILLIANWVRSEEITESGLWTVSGWISILVSGFYEIIDALVALYGASDPEPIGVSNI